MFFCERAKSREAILQLSLLPLCDVLSNHMFFIPPPLTLLKFSFAFDAPNIRGRSWTPTSTRFTKVAAHRPLLSLLFHLFYIKANEVINLLLRGEKHFVEFVIGAEYPILLWLQSLDIAIIR